MTTMCLARFSRLPATLAGRLVGLFIVAALAGCASTKVSEREELVTGPIPRPGQIWVYDFAATAEEIPGESALAGQIAPGTATPAQVAEDKKVGAELAAQLIDQIHAMGMPATHGWPGARPAVNDLVIRGYLLAVQEGSEGKRVIIGFASGGSDLKVAVEGFEMTRSGLRKLGSGDTEATGNKTPGVGVGALTMLATHNPAGLIISGAMKYEGERSGSDTIEGRVKQTVKEIGDVLKTRFEEQGWIS